jgi:hypothetical protein
MRDQQTERAVNAVSGAADLASGAIGKRTLVDSVSRPSAPGAGPARSADGRPPVVQAKRSATDTDESRKPSHNIAVIAKEAIEELDGDKRKKVLLAEVLAAARLQELPAFTAILKAAPHETYGDHFIFLINELEEDYGSQSTVSILQEFAKAGIDITSKLDAYNLQPLAAVATFKLTAERFKTLYLSGDLSEADQRRIGFLLGDAGAALRSIEGPPRKHGPQVKQAGVAGAAVAAWELAGALAADDVTAVGVADDVAIPFVVVGAIVLTGIAAFSGGPKPAVLDFGPAKTAVQAALRQMTDLLAISSAMAVQGVRARGQIKNVAMHLARLLVLASVGGHPPEEPPKKDGDNDRHWWKEIKASVKEFLQATKGASRKQILRELLRTHSEAQIAEIEAALARAEAMMGENIGRIFPPP